MKGKQKYSQHKGYVYCMTIAPDLHYRIKPIINFVVKKCFNTDNIDVVFFLFSKFDDEYSMKKVKHLLKENNINFVIYKSVKEFILKSKEYKKYSFLFFYRKRVTIKSSLELEITKPYLLCPSENKKLIPFSVICLYRINQENNKKNEFNIIRRNLFKSLVSKYLFLVKNYIFYYLLFLPSYFLLNKLVPANNKDIKRNKKILFIRMDHIGDIICTLPSLKALKRVYYNYELHFLGSKWSIEPLRVNKHLYDKIIIFNASWHNRSKNYKISIIDFFKLLRLVVELRKEKYDIVIQPREEGMNVALAALISARKTVSGYINTRPLSKLIANNFISDPVAYSPDKIYHISEWPRLCLEKMGTNITYEDIRKAYSQFRTPELESLISQYKNKGFKLCLVVMKAGSKVREWPLNKWRLLIHQLYYQKNTISIIVGTEKEKNIIKELGLKCEYIDLIGKTNFKNLETLIRLCDLVISIDTSIMHLTSLLGVKLIALFGAGRIDLARPIFSDNAILIKKELGCSGCGDKCFLENRYPCMDRIMVNDILNAFDTIIG